MDTIFLYNQRKESFPTEVVRYFTINGKKYLIFTLNEKDESGYVQLYVAKIENEYGKLIMKNITDDSEWSLFKTTIQNIVMNNRNGILNDTDLDFSELNNMVVTEFRIFKLKETVAKELGSNKNVKKIPEKKEPKTLEAASAQSNNLTIEEILKQVSDGARNAKEEANVSIDMSATPKASEDVAPVVSAPIAPTPVVSAPVAPITPSAPVSLEPKTIETPVPMSIDSDDDFVYTEVADKELEKEEVKPSLTIEDAINEQHNVSTDDYKTKYQEALTNMKNLEAENMKLINELVEAKAKLETIKDILD